MYKDYLEMEYRVESFVLKDSNTFGLIGLLKTFFPASKTEVRKYKIICFMETQKDNIRDKM